MSAKPEARVIVSLDCMRFTAEELALIDDRAKEQGCTREEIVRQLLVSGLEKAKAEEGVASPPSHSDR